MVPQEALLNKSKDDDVLAGQWNRIFSVKSGRVKKSNSCNFLETVYWRGSNSVEGDEYKTKKNPAGDRVVKSKSPSLIR